MEDIFNKLNTIQKVNLKIDLFDSIENKINQQNLISTKWIGVVAALFLLFITSEYFVIKQLQVKNNNVASPTLISQNNKFWYYEEN
jgi:hypothetical protein